MEYSTVNAMEWWVKSIILSISLFAIADNAQQMITTITYLHTMQYNTYFHFFLKLLTSQNLIQIQLNIPNQTHHYLNGHE